MCKYVKRFGLSRAHKVPPVLYKVCLKTKFFVTSWIWNKVNVKMKGMLHIYNDCTIDWHQVCENMWSGLGWVIFTKYHLSDIKYAGKQSPGSEIKSRSKWKVCCTSTMIVQLIGIKCVQICKAAWAESHTQSTTPIRDGRTHACTDGCTDMNPMSPVRGIHPAGDKELFLSMYSNPPWACGCGFLFSRPVLQNYTQFGTILTWEILIKTHTNSDLYLMLVN